MKIGNTVKARDDYYGITSTYGTYKVVSLRTDGRMDIKILAHELYPGEVGQIYTVDEKYFYKVNSDSKEDILCKIAHLQKLFEERKA